MAKISVGCKPRALFIKLDIGRALANEGLGRCLQCEKRHVKVGGK